MSDIYEHISPVIDEEQKKHWLEATEPTQGTPDKNHLVRVSDVVHIASEMLQTLNARFFENSRQSYYPDARRRLQQEHADRQPLGGIFDADPSYFIGIGNVLDSIVSQFTPADDSIQAIWENELFYTDDQIADTEPPDQTTDDLEKFPGIPPLPNGVLALVEPRRNPLPESPWWELDTEDTRRPAQRPRPSSTPRRGTASGAVAIWQGVEIGLDILDQILEGDIPEAHPKEQEFARQKKLRPRDVTRNRERKKKCLQFTRIYIERAHKYIREITDPNSPRNKRNNWGYRTRDKAKRTTKKFASRK